MRILSSAAIVLLMTGAAIAGPQAAPDSIILQKHNGKVLINAGQGFQKVSVGVSLRRGDRIMLGTDAQAQIYFPAARCSATLAPAQVTVIGGPEMCQQAIVPATSVPEASHMIVMPANSGPPPAGEIPPLLIAGGIFVAGTAAAIEAFSSNNRNSSPPVSAP